MSASVENNELVEGCIQWHDLLSILELYLVETVVDVCDKVFESGFADSKEYHNWYLWSQTRHVLPFVKNELWLSLEFICWFHLRIWSEMW